MVGKHLLGKKCVVKDDYHEDRNGEGIIMGFGGKASIYVTFNGGPRHYTLKQIAKYNNYGREHFLQSHYHTKVRGFWTIIDNVKVILQYPNTSLFKKIYPKHKVLNNLLEVKLC